MALRVLFGRDPDTHERAQKDLQAIETAQRNVRYARDITPRGIAVHTAKYAVECDECSQTYWASDPYAKHRGCKGPTGKTGFAH